MDCESFRCEECNLRFANRQEEELHLCSLLHHIRLDLHTKEKGLKFHLCSLCGVSATSLQSYMGHLEGKKHKSRLKSTNTTVHDEKAKKMPGAKGSESSNTSTNFPTVSNTRIKNINRVANNKAHLSENTKYSKESNSDNNYQNDQQLSNSMHDSLFYYPQHSGGICPPYTGNNMWKNRPYYNQNWNRSHWTKWSSNQKHYNNFESNYCNFYNSNDTTSNVTNIGNGSIENNGNFESYISKRNGKITPKGNKYQFKDFNKCKNKSPRKDTRKFLNFKTDNSKNTGNQKMFRKKINIIQPSSLSHVEFSACNTKVNVTESPTPKKYNLKKSPVKTSNKFYNLNEKKLSKRSPDKQCKSNERGNDSSIPHKEDNNKDVIAIQNSSMKIQQNKEMQNITSKPIENKEKDEHHQVNIEHDITGCSKKLHKLSQLLENSKIEIGAYNKELINKLVNFPRGRKEQLHLEKWMQEHSRTKKKLTLPRFNLPLGRLEMSKNSVDSPTIIMQNIVFEVVNSLPEEVINSLVLAIKRSETDASQQSVADECSEINISSVFSSASSLECTNNSTSNSSSEQLSYTDQLQWLQKWIMDQTYRNKEHSNISSSCDQTSVSNQQNVEKCSNSITDVNLSFPKNIPTEDNQFDIHSIKIKEEKIDNHEDSRNEDVNIKHENNTEGENNPTNTAHETNKSHLNNFEELVDSHLCVSSSVEESEPTSTTVSDTSFTNPANVQIKVEPMISEDVPTSTTVSDTSLTNPENVQIKVEPVTAEDDQYNCDSDGIEHSSVFNDDKIAEKDSINSVPPLCMDNSYSNPTHLSRQSSSINEVINVEEIIHRNNLLQTEIAEKFRNSTLNSLPSETVTQTLVEEILKTSQQEEDMRKLGQRLDKNITDLWEMLQELKNKRIQLTQEEDQLRSRRMELLENLRGTTNIQQDIPISDDINITVENSSGNIVLIVSNSSSNVSDMNPLITPERPNSASNSQQCSFRSKSSNISNFDNSVSSTATFIKRNEKHCSNAAECSSNDKNRQQIITKNRRKLKHSFDCDDLNVNKRTKKQKTNVNTLSVETSNNNNNSFQNNLPKSTSSLNAKSHLIEDNLRIKLEICNGKSNSTSSPEANKENTVLNTKEKFPLIQEHTPSSSVPMVINEDTNHIHRNHGKTCSISRLNAHKSAVVAIKVHKRYLYTGSSDATAKRFDLEDPSNIVTYSGHHKTVSSLHIIDKGGGEVQVFTASMDGYLRCFDSQSGHCLLTIDLNTPILCMAEGWGKLYLGLHSGQISLFSLMIKKVVDFFQCSNSAVSCIVTDAEGAQKILCVASYDNTLTVWDARTGLLLRCLEGSVKPPCYIQITGNVVYTTTTDRKVLIHNLSCGKLQKALSWPSSATGLHVTDNHILSCSFDGLVRCYAKEGWMLHALYYGAGKSSVLCMNVYNDWVFTGNRKGIVEAFKFNPQFVIPCQFGKCYFRFGRLEDIKYHLQYDHFRNIGTNLKSCVWRGCDVDLGSTNEREQQDHIFQHVKSNCTDLEESLYIIS